MATVIPIEYQEGLLAKVLEQHMRQKLREFFTEAAKPVIEEMVLQAVADLKVTVEAHRNDFHMHDLINVILTDKRTK
jgi:hypothetical protein